MCIPFKNSYIHQNSSPPYECLDCVSLSKTVIFIRPLPISFNRIIVYPFQKQLYSSRKEIREEVILCIPFKNSYIHLNRLDANSLNNCVSLSKTVIFIPSIFASKEKIIVYPFQKQLYSSLKMKIKAEENCVSLSKTVIFIQMN